MTAIQNWNFCLSSWVKKLESPTNAKVDLLLQNINAFNSKKKLNWENISFFLGWCYGFSFDEPEKVGLFPSSYVSFKTEDLCKYEN